METRESSFILEKGQYNSYPQKRERQERPRELPAHQSHQLSGETDGTDPQQKTHLVPRKQQLAPSQTGYRRHRSTEDQLMLISQEIENAFQRKEKVVSVFFDLSKAFDEVWKEGLLQKMSQLGIRICLNGSSHSCKTDQQMSF